MHALAWYRMHSRTGSARTVGVASDTGAHESENTAELPVHTKSREGNLIIIGIPFTTIYYQQYNFFSRRLGATLDLGIFTTLFLVFPVSEVTHVATDVAGKNNDMFQPPPTSINIQIPRYTPTESSVPLPAIRERRVCNTCITRSCLIMTCNSSDG